MRYAISYALILIVNRSERQIELLTIDEAREIIKQANLHVNWHNLGSVLHMIGVMEQSWGRHPNDRWIPDYDLAWREHHWLKNNADNLFEALRVIRKAGVDKSLNDSVE